MSLELAKNPDLLVLDEPTSGLDPIVRDEVLDILRCVAKEKNTSVLFSSHITEDIEKIADRVIFINNGRIVLQGDKKEIKKKYVKLNQQQYVILVNAGMAKDVFQSMITILWIVIWQ